MDQTEAELESFRQKWREEVTTRRRSNQNSSASTGKTPERHHESRLKGAPPVGPAVFSSGPSDINISDEIEPRTYHDVPNKEDSLKLDGDRSHLEKANKEPRSALEHYEKAVERESQGSLGDSVNLYRRAFKVCSNIPYDSRAESIPSWTLQSMKSTRISTFLHLSSLPKSRQTPIHPTHLLRSLILPIIPCMASHRLLTTSSMALPNYLSLQRSLQRMPRHHLPAQ